MAGYTTKVMALNDGTVKIRRYKLPIVTENKNTGGDSTTKDKVINRRNQENGTTKKSNLTKSRNDMNNLILHNYEIWKTFGTLTFAKDITRDDAIYHWENYVRQVRRFDPNVVMIKVDEFTKNGRPHFHFISNVECGSELYPLLETPLSLWNKESQSYKTVEYANFKYWKHGFSQAMNIKNTDENFNIALYMTKYMMKDFDKRHYNKQKYTVINRKKLAKPIEVKLNEFQTAKVKQVEQYLTNNNYNIEIYEYKPLPVEQDKYALAFQEIKTKVSNDDVKDIQRIILQIDD
ncbi:hypothetical protein PT044_08775 [Erysipelothrix rhusiopathiae]|nr:hypothetical protein [Erysipelothrix rhusiopathiae]